MGRNDFNVSDFVAQIAQVGRLGPPGRWIGMIPGVRELTMELGAGEADIMKQIACMRAIHGSMSRAERSDPDLLNGSRRRRIARGAGVQVSDVSQFVNQFRSTREMMRAMNSRRSRPVGAIGSVFGLVTDSRSQRDPSWVHRRLPENVRLWLLWLAMAFCSVALLARAILGR